MRKSGSARRSLRPILITGSRLKRKWAGGQLSRLRSRRPFSTIEVCHFFDISKATLYRWEREGLISMPSRDWRNWRMYSSANMAEIKTLMRRRVAQ